MGQKWTSARIRRGCLALAGAALISLLSSAAPPAARAAQADFIGPLPPVAAPAARAAALQPAPAVASAISTPAPKPPLPVFGRLDTPFPKGAISPRLHCLSRGDPAKKLVALTFDDGPNPEYTLDLLAVLAKYRVPATFFYVGSQCDKFPELVRDTYAAGNEVANHTYTHKRLPTLSLEQKAYEIDATQNLIAEEIGVQPRFLRPPGGHRDTAAEELLAKRGMVVAMWDISLCDADNNRAPSDMLRQVEDQIRPGSIILAHTGIPATVDALPLIIHNLEARGFTFVTMSQLADGLDVKNVRRGRGDAGLSNFCFHERPAGSGQSKTNARRKRAKPAAPRSPQRIETPPAEPAAPPQPPAVDQE